MCVCHLTHSARVSIVDFGNCMNVITAIVTVIAYTMSPSDTLCWKQKLFVHVKCFCCISSVLMRAREKVNALMKLMKMKLKLYLYLSLMLSHSFSLYLWFSRECTKECSGAFEMFTHKTKSKMMFLCHQHIRCVLLVLTMSP